MLTSGTKGQLGARSRLFILLIPMLLYSAASLIVSVSFCKMGTKSALMIFDRGNQTFEWDEIDMLRFEEGDCACFTLEAHGSTAAERMIRRTSSAPV